MLMQEVNNKAVGVEVGRGGLWELSTFHSIFHLKLLSKRGAIRFFKNILKVSHGPNVAHACWIQLPVVTCDLIQHPHFTDRKTEEQRRAEAMAVSKTKWEQSFPS